MCSSFHTVGDDSLLSGAWNAIGDYYFERQKYSNAITYYSQGQNSGRLLECYFILEDFAGLQRLGDALPDCHPLLQVVHCSMTVYLITNGSVSAIHRLLT